MTVVPMPDNAPAAQPQDAYSGSGYSLSDLMAVAREVSSTTMVPVALRNKPADVLAVFLYGSEIGLPIMNALQLVDMIEGKPCLNAQGQRAQIMRHGHHFWTEESTAERAVVCGQRKDDDRVHRAEFTIDEARAANLTNKNNWKKHPADMLVARATTRLARRAFADCLLGVAYDADELDDARPSLTVDVDVEPAPELPAGPRPISADNAERIRARAAELGMDDAALAEAVFEATAARTSLVEDVRTDEVPALRDEFAKFAAADLSSPGVAVVGDAGLAPAAASSPAGDAPASPASPSGEGVADRTADPSPDAVVSAGLHPAAPSDTAGSGSAPSRPDPAPPPEWKALGYASAADQAAAVKHLNIVLRGAGHATDEARYAAVSAALGRLVASTKEVAKGELGVVFAYVGSAEPEQGELG